MPGSPASGDLDLVQALFERRVLESGQLSRITGRSRAVIRRRFRGYLHEAGLVRALEGTAADQKAYALSPKGMELAASLLGLNSKHLPFSTKPPSGPGSPFYRHMRLANDVSIGFELACRDPKSQVELAEQRFEWEMTTNLKARRSKKPWEKFLICESLPELHDPQERAVLRPDLVLVLRHRPKDYRVAAYVEADRATMSVRGALMQKLRPYYLLWVRQGFSRYEAVAMRIVFVFSMVKTDQRLESFWGALESFCQRHAAEHERFMAARRRLAQSLGRPEPLCPSLEDFARCFRLGRWDQLRQADLLRAPLWHTIERRQVPFVRGTPIGPSTSDRNEAAE